MDAGIWANLILYIHFLYVVAVILPVFLIPIGARFNWRWVWSWKLRAIHVGMMGFVLVEVLVGLVCPLTWLENYFLDAAGKSGYQNSFIAYWVERIMYWNAPQWVFILAYLLFFVLILFLWKKYRPIT